MRDDGEKVVLGAVGGLRFEARFALLRQQPRALLFVPALARDVPERERRLPLVDSGVRALCTRA